MAKQLGGSGRDPRNLVTLFQNGPNSPEMRNYETSVRKAVESGEIVFYKVTPIYNSNNLIPTGVTMEATGTKNFNLIVSILNRKKYKRFLIMSDYFSLLSKNIHSPSIVYHTGTDKDWQEFEKNPESVFQLTIKNSSTNMEQEG